MDTRAAKFLNLQWGHEEVAHHHIVMEKTLKAIYSTALNNSKQKQSKTFRPE